MRICKGLFLLIPVLLFHTSIHGQGSKYNKANATFEAGEYPKAIELYKDAYDAAEDKARKTEIVFKISEC